MVTAAPEDRAGAWRADGLVLLSYLSRSGSTLLARHLDAVPSVGVTLEANLPDGILRPELVIDRPESVDRDLDRLYADAKFRAWDVSREALRERLLGLAFPLRFSAILREILALAFGGRDVRWPVLKQENCIWRIEATRRLYPGAQIVFVERDPRAIYNSQRTSLDSRTGRPMSSNPLVVALMYARAMARVDRCAGERWFHRVRYEDLVAAPQEALESLLRAAGIPLPALALAAPDGAGYVRRIPEAQRHLHANVGGPALPERAGAWQHELSPSEIDVIQWVAGRALDRRGYPRVGCELSPAARLAARANCLARAAWPVARAAARLVRAPRAHRTEAPAMEQGSLPIRGLLLTSRYAIGMIAQHALLFVLVPLCTGYLAPEQLGVWSLLQVTVGILAQVVLAPVSVALTRFYYHPRYRERQGRLASTLLLLFTVQIAALAGAYLAAAPVIDRLLFAGAGHIGEVRSFALVLVAMSASMLLMNFLRLVEAAWSFVVLSLLQAVVTTAVTLALLAWRDWGVLALVAGQVAGQGLQIVGAAFVLRRALGAGLDAGAVRAPLKYGYMSVPAAYGAMLLQGGDRYVINGFVSTAQVGIYAFGSLLANALTILFARPLVQGLTPIIHQLEGSPDRQREFITRMTLYSAWIGTWLAVAMGCFAQELTGLLSRSASYDGAWCVIPMLAFARVLHALSGMTNLGMRFADRPGINSAVTLGAAALNILACVALVPWMGIAGAAAGTLLAMVAWVAVNALLSRRHFDLEFAMWRILGGMAAGGAIVVLALLVPETWPAAPRLLARGAAVAAFPAALLAGGIMARSDLAALRSLCRQARRHGVKGMVGSFLRG